MRVGSLVYATDQGLGILAKSFFDHGIVTSPMIVRHGRHPTHDEWFPGAPQLMDLRRPRDIQAAKDHCLGCDVMLFFETPFIWDLIPFCRELKVKTAIMPMHECMPTSYVDNPQYRPDLWLCPSALDLIAFQDRGPTSFLPVPVSVPWRQRTRAEVFVHNAGHGGLKGRNGTGELFAAMEFIRSPAKFIVRSQERLPTMRNFECEVDYRIDTADYRTLWDEGDAFIFPEKFNGLSLPLQEARAAGMLVIATDRFPMNQWLDWVTPEGDEPFPLIPTRGSRKNRIGPAYLEFDEAIIDPKDIAARIDAWYGQDITEYSASGREWAETMSWEKLGPKYREVLENL